VFLPTVGPEGDVTVLREEMGVLQHHDAVSGTAKQHVTEDYAQRLANGIDECSKVIKNKNVLFNS
jgi:lysosomal alpha-mannosidase